MKKILSIMLCFTMTLTLITGCAQNQQGAETEVSSSKTEQKSSENQVSYDKEITSDVVIVGAGGGGLSTAIEAVKNGAESVAIIEKLNITGGSLNLTSGTISGAETIIQEIDGLKDSKKSYVEDIVAEGSKNGGKPNVELIEIFADKNAETINWLWESGLKDRKFSTDKEGRKSVFAPEHTLYSFPRTYKPSPEDKTAYKSATHEILDQEIAKISDKVKIYFETDAKHLIPNEKGQILGVEAIDLKTNEKIKFNANKGVVMATGGYSSNPKLMAIYNTHTAGTISAGLPTANGYGFYMMQEVGGAIDEDSMGWIPTFPGGRENPEAPGSGIIAPLYVSQTGGIFVNSNGERYINETELDNVKREIALDKQTFHYEVFTDKILEDLGSAKRDTMWKYLYLPQKEKFVLEASSLEELAQKMEVPADVFVKTVEEYNLAVESGKTDSFGRNFFKDDNPNNININKIEGSKYYAVKIKPLALVTVGGVKANKNMQVLSMDGNPIPGLYAAGECVQVWGSYISSGTGVMGPITFGRVAAKSVMTLPLEEGYKPAPASNIIDSKVFEKAQTAKSNFVIGELKDGKYSATVDGQSGPMTVETVVKEGKISEVKVVSNQETEAIAKDALVKLPAEIVEKNSLDVDTITGATLTSGRIIKAVEECLKEASK